MSEMQSGPLSALPANVLLDEVDKELERRGHWLVRYTADAKEANSAVGSVFQRNFLGGGDIKRRMRPACPVVRQGRAGNRSPYADRWSAYAAFFSAARAALALSARAVKPAASLMAMSERIFRSSSMPAFFKPLMSCE